MGKHQNSNAFPVFYHSLPSFPSFAFAAPAHRPLIRTVIGEGYQIAFFVLISSPSTLFCFCASYSVFVVVETTALHPSAKNTRDSIPPRLQLRLRNAAACPAQEFSVGGRSTKASFSSRDVNEPGKCGFGSGRVFEMRARAKCGPGGLYLENFFLCCFERGA